MRPVVSYDDIVYDDAASVSYDDPGQPPAKKQKRKHKKSKPQTRELTQAEVWDDAALIDAWNAANEEYEAYHGPGKGWKDEPTVKSSLWYDVPPSVDVPDEEDSKPLDFDSFVPTHDPSLDLPAFDQPPSVPGPDYSSYYLPTPPGPMVSRDEAFTRALGAMYWGGYWTAVYHCQTATAQNSEEHVDINGDEEEASSDDEGFVSTQRDL